jgi:AcrR family transcriptional regulator
MNDAPPDRESTRARQVRRARRKRQRARPYGGLSPEERRRTRRERLLDAGLALFGTEGFSAASIERLCALAGVATRHFYEEFDGREALLRAVYDRVIAETRDAVRLALTASPEDPRERTRNSLGAFLHAYLDDPRRARVACLEVVGVSPELERHRRSVIHEFAAVIAGESERSARAGHLPTRDFGLGAIAMAGATNELVIEWLTRKAPPSVEELRDELLALFVAILAGSFAAADYLKT